MSESNSVKNAKTNIKLLKAISFQDQIADKMFRQDMDGILTVAHNYCNMVVENEELTKHVVILKAVLKKCLKDEESRRKKLLNKSTAACYSDERIERMRAAIELRNK